MTKGLGMLNNSWGTMEIVDQPSEHFTLKVLSNDQLLKIDSLEEWATVQSSWSGELVSNAANLAVLIQLYIAEDPGSNYNVVILLSMWLIFNHYFTRSSNTALHNVIFIPQITFIMHYITLEWLFKCML